MQTFAVPFFSLSQLLMTQGASSRSGWLVNPPDTSSSFFREAKPLSLRLPKPATSHDDEITDDLGSRSADLTKFERETANWTDVLVQIVIVNYQTPELTIEALDAVASGRNDFRTTAIVVDNGSNDDSAERIGRAIECRGWSGWCRVVKAKDNRGFSAGNNLGIKSADADAYILLNSDALVRPSAIPRMIVEMLSNPAAGIICPRLEWPDGKPQVSCFQFHRPLTELVYAAATGPVTWLFKSALLPCATSANGGHQVCEPDWTSFACVLIRREVFQDVGLMDEGFFMYYEDVDFCRRARMKGHVVRHCPEARVVHLRGGSSPVKDLQSRRMRRPRYYFQARSRYYAKNFGRWGLLRANAFWTIGRMISFARETFGRRSHICHREWIDIWSNFRDPV